MTNPTIKDIEPNPPTLKEQIDITRDDVAFETGERIAWQYEHSLNSRSRLTRTKYGRFIGRIRHTKRWSGDRLAMVHFDYNKRVSKVPLDDLYHVKALTKGGKK